MLLTRTITKKIIGATLLTIGLQGTVNASAIYNEVDDTLRLIDVNQDVVYFTESYANGVGRYTVTNNVENSAIIGFGVTNFNTIAAIESDGQKGIYEDFGGGHNDITSWYYNAFTLTADNWETADLGWQIEGSAAELFGEAETFFTEGENTLNWYSSNDGAIYGGLTWDGFVFLGNLPASSLYALVYDEASDSVFMTNAIAPLNATVSNVDEPAMIGMMAILMVLAGYRRKR